MDDRLKRFSILVIDDDRLMQKLVRDVLAKFGFGCIRWADDARRALQLFETEPFDFIICDWRLPGSPSGIELARLIRGAETIVSQAIPILMLTGNAEAQHVITARDAGVNEYLVKPFTVKELLGRVSAIIDNRREFVVAPNYKGPSRRRQNLPPLDGIERRKNNLRPVKMGHDRRPQ